MRHQKKKGRLNRNISHRKAMLKNMAVSLFQYQRIETTLAKAKALRIYVEPIITMAKKEPESIAARRRVFQKLCDKDTVKRLFDEIAPLYKETPGGYTRILKLSIRKGDGSRKAIIELTKRTISDDILLRKDKPKKEIKKKVSKRSEEKTADRQQEKPEKGKGKKKKGEVEKTPQQEIEKAKDRNKGEEKIEGKITQDIKKEKAKNERKKISTKGIFKRFRRKSMG